MKVKVIIPIEVEIELDEGRKLEDILPTDLGYQISIDDDFGARLLNYYWDGKWTEVKE